jgi:1-acyl-sn-glycerol-3-phosphate acyltransferase
MDTPLLIKHLPFLFGFIVKEELMKIPVFAGGMRTIGCVAVSRGRDRADYSVLDAVAKDVASGKNILIFPEGTRAPDDAFLPFKKGGVILAIKAGVPILPVAVSGTGRVVPARVLRVLKGDLLLRVGAPIRTDELTLDDRDMLLETVRTQIESMYVPGYGDEVRSLVDAS